jgi:ribosomal protein S18 acetylase RimI-like enzyme
VTGHGVREAVEADIPELVRLRAVLFADLAGTWGAAPPGGQWRQACAAALTAALADESMRVIVSGPGPGLACCGIGAIDRRLPSPFNPGGQIGHVFGIVTDPAHRGHGHARAVTQELLDWFDRHGITRVDLNASPDGQHLYRSLGFTGHPDPTLSRTRPPR